MNQLACEDAPTAPTLSQAWATAQVNLKPAHFDKVNPHFKSKFASLASCQKAAGVYADQGIIYTQLPTILDTGHFVLRMVVLYGNQAPQIVSTYPLPDPSKATPQQMGSALTYARRYQLCAVFGIVAEDDDDGNAAATIQSAAPTITEEQVLLLARAIEARGTTVEAFCQYYKVDGLSFLPADKFEGALATLSRPRKEPK